jgi:Endonuclease/Exonuclease/phosphatase family
VAFDFLQILLDALAARGVTYTTVIARDNFDVSGPGLFPFGLMGVRLTERTAIIARTDPHTGPLTLSHPQQGGFQDVSVLPTLNGPFPLGGGWLSVDATTVDRTVRFITTHLDGFSPAVAGEQTGELLAGPAATDLPVLIAGDFNSVTTDPAYGDLVGAGFTDVWAARNHQRPGLTCCQVPPDSIVNPVSQLSTRIDYIFTSGRSAPKDAHAVGDNPSARTESGLWPSDHAGLVATLEMDKKRPPDQRGEASPER